MLTSQSTTLRSLEDICIQVVSAHDYWIVQKRRLQYLPEDAANNLLQLLLWRGRLQTPSLLETFRHSATRLHINAKHLGLQLGAEWIAYVAGLSHLQQLSLQHAPRLKDKTLSSLTRLSNSLTSLDITGCSSITNKACGEVLGRLTALQSLVITGTGIRPPILSHLTHLTHLSHLNLGGCGVSDNEITCHIPVFQHLQGLDLWGSEVGDVSVVHLNQLPHLCQLSMAWSQLRTGIPVHSSLTRLDLSHCRLEGSWHEAEGLLDAASGLRLQELMMVHTRISASYGEVLEAMIRASSQQLRLLDLTALSGCDLLPLLLALEAATALHSLSLSATRLADDYCPTLTPCSALQTLDLSHNPEVTAAGLRATVPDLQGLRRLNLLGTRFEDDGLEVLWGLSDLQQLVLAETAVAWDWRGPEAAEGASDERQQATAGLQYTAERGWRSLQVLDLSSTEVDDAGCQQLAQQLQLAHSRSASDSYTATTGSGCHANEGAGTAGNEQPGVGGISSSGLLVLSIGSRSGSSCKVGKKGLAALARISTLQQLTLQRCQLQDQDLKHLSNLQQLRVLHIQHIDPWLLSSEALQELAVTHDMRRLKLVTRDAKTLYSAEAHWLGLSSQLNSLVTAQQQQQSWLQEGAEVLVEIAAEVGLVDHPRVAPSSSTVNWPVAAAPTPPPTASAGSRAMTPGSSGSSSKRSTAGGNVTSTASSVYRRLSEYDERYRYSKQELLDLRQAGTADPSQQQRQQQVWMALGPMEDFKASSGDTGGSDEP